MQVTSKWRTATLMMAALVVGSVFGPPIVQAASTASIVTVQGWGTAFKAKVNSTGQLSVNPNLTKTGAGQVEVAPADPGRAVRVFAFPTCGAGGIYTVPAGLALIITGVNFYNSQNVSAAHELDLDVGPRATPCTTIMAAGIAPTSEDRVSQNQSFNPGIPVPAGDAVGVSESNELGSVEFYGYLVPKADVHAAPQYARSPRATTHR